MGNGKLTTEDGSRHIPVLAAEVLELLDCTRGSTIVDCTTGGGGHAKAVLERISPTGFLLGIDKDARAIAVAEKVLARFSGHFKLVLGDFKDLPKFLDEAGVAVVDGILFDLGVSMFQLEDAGRGFSFHKEGPLDMRMDENAPLTASEVINAYPERRLAKIIRDYGEEPWSRRIAAFVAQARDREPIRSTGELAEIVKAAIPASARRRGGHPARRTFQAIRIEVNQELSDLGGILRKAVGRLAERGRILVISYHSLEDRIVKRTYKELAQGCICPPSLPECRCGHSPVLRILTSKPVRPSQSEIEQNPRADSARLRAAEKLGSVT